MQLLANRPASRTPGTGTRARLLRALLLVAVGGAVDPAPVRADEVPPAEPAVGRVQSHALETWEEHRHFLTLLALGTHEYADSRTAATVGVDYEYRFHRLVGAGFVAEHALEDIRETTILAVADLHVWRELVLQVGPGLAIVSEDEEPSRTEFAFRAGVILEVEIGRLCLTPQVHYDYTTGEDAVVFGTGIGWRF